MNSNTLRQQTGFRNCDLHLHNMFSDNSRKATISILVFNMCRAQACQGLLANCSSCKIFGAKNCLSKIEF